MRVHLLLLALVFGLGGCAGTARFDAATVAVRDGDFMRAERLYYMAIREGNQVGLSWLGLGTVFQHQKRYLEASHAWKMSARWGEPAARAILATMGAPVPVADLFVAAGGMPEAGGLNTAALSDVEPSAEGAMEATDSASIAD